ncbi:unnamed protein product [marine sediment metagenome]|uniref:2TM domain-containing protein n=1 Tax=marine sediment metagenome TaxID=412755 RepID=X1HIX4_9ZZZZ
MNEFNENGFSEENLRRIAALKIKFRLSVKIHLTAYILTIILLILINVLFMPFFWWVLFPIFGWLIGVAEHITSYIIYARGVYPSAKRGAIYHSVAYIFVMLLLFVTNYFNSPFYYWSIFPAFLWGTGLVIHLVTYYIYHRPTTDEQGVLKSRRERAVEKEMGKMQSRLKKE